MVKLFSRRGSDPRRDLAEILDGYELPSFRSTVVSTLQLLRDEDASSEKIAQQIEFDPGLHTRVLRAANAAAFGLSKEVSAVSQAVNLLGQSRLETLVLTVAAQEALPRGQTPGFDSRRFWCQSAVRALIARGFARLLHPRTQEPAFAAGLLLDLAVPIFVSVKGAKYVATYCAMEEEAETSLVSLEQAELGYDHSMAGGLVAEVWELPTYIRHAITSHHDEGADGVDPGIRLAALLRDHDGPEDVEPIVAEAADRYGVPAEDAAAIIERAFEEAQEFSSLSE